jgi:hypothetical protein
MPYFIDPPEMLNKILRLSKEQQGCPLAVIEGYFNDRSLGETRAMLREMVETCTTTENTSYRLPAQRDLLLHLVSQVEYLLEAAYLLRGCAGEEKKE